MAQSALPVNDVITAGHATCSTSLCKRTACLPCLTIPPNMPDLRSNFRKVLFDEVDELPDKIDDLITAVDESDERKINTNKLKIDTDELKVGTDELKINTRLNTNKPKLDPFDRLDELLRTVEKYDLTTHRAMPLE
jgi:hypothetical protein